MAGCSAAFYLVHALGAKDNWVEMEKTMVGNFIQAARANTISRIVFGRPR